MRKVLLFMAMMVCFQTALMAETNKHKGTIAVNYYFVYSQCTFNKVKASTYFARKKDKGKALKGRIARAFINAANSKSMRGKGYVLSNNSKSRYEVAIYLQEVDDDGEHEVVGKVYKKGTQKVIETVKVHVKGGRDDSMERQLIEQLERSGEKFGDKLADDVLDDLYD